MIRTILSRGISALLSILVMGAAAKAQEQPHTQLATPQHRQIVHSRNEDTPQPTTAPEQTKPNAVTATDAERSAVFITSFDLELRLLPLQNAMNMRAKITVKNDSLIPLGKIPLQISSSLDWIEVRRFDDAGTSANIPLYVRLLDSDIDHTGQVHEDVIVLEQPLAAGASLSLELLYAGTVTLTARRLERIGTPHEAAVHTDWDRIDPNFVALRGFGNTLWHPAAAPPVLLGDGARLFQAIATWKERESHARVHMQVTLEYVGEQPNLTLLNGQRAGVASAPAASAEIDGPRILTATTKSSELGFAAPSVFVATLQEKSRDGVRVFAGPQHEESGAAWQAAARSVTPMLERWLGKERKRELLVVDLPEQTDAPFALDNILFHPLRPASVRPLPSLLADALTHAYFISPRLWLSQGVPEFISSLWTEQNEGREAALAELEIARAPLALAEPDKPGSEGEPLIRAASEVYSRTKSEYVLWMLRSLLGDDALASALKEYRAEDDKSPKYFQQLCENASHQDLEWFFEDWVYRDAGLPSLSITAVHSRAVPPGPYLTEVEIGNTGNATASVTVTVRAGPATTTQSIRVGARGSAVTRFVMPAKPDSVMVNDGTVPEAESSRHKQKLQ